MANRIEATEAVKDLALVGLPPAKIQTKLESRGLGGFFDRVEIEALVTEVRAARTMLPRHPSRVWPRLVGSLAIAMGICGIALGSFGYLDRHSPGGYGFWAIVLGVILIVKPGWAGERLR